MSLPSLETRKPVPVATSLPLASETTRSITAGRAFLASDLRSIDSVSARELVREAEAMNAIASDVNDCSRRFTRSIVAMARCCSENEIAASHAASAAFGLDKPGMTDQD